MEKKTVNERGFFIFILRVLPKSLISRIAGYLARAPLPRFLLSAIMRRYSATYGVLGEEIEAPDSGFRTFDQFFTRKLKTGVHVIDADADAIVAPVDSKLTGFGPIEGKRIIQAKGIDYPLERLIPSEMHRHFIDGSSITLYLSPGDYHRIHSPVSGWTAGCVCVPGKLFPVRDYVVNGLRGLFSINERVITCIDTGRGMAAVCMIGAMCVGRITVSHCARSTNRFLGRRRECLFGDTALRVKKGDEIGIFHIGSTVILLFEKGMADVTGLSSGGKVRIGERIAEYRK